MPSPEYEPPPPGYRDLLAAYDRARDAWEADPRLQNFAVLATGIEILYRELAKPGKFALGQVLLTPGATEALFTAQQVPRSSSSATSTATGASCAPRTGARTSARCGSAAGSSPPTAPAPTRSSGSSPSGTARAPRHPSLDRCHRQLDQEGRSRVTQLTSR